MLRIPGLGPKKVAALFHELGVTTLADLKVACESGRVAELKGFGKKTAQTIIEGIQHAQEAGQRVRRTGARATQDLADRHGK